MPDTMQPAPLPSLYQLRVVVRGVSPLIWRRLLLPADTTIAGRTRCCRSRSAGRAPTCIGSSSRSRVRHRLRRRCRLPRRSPPGSCRRPGITADRTVRRRYDFTDGWCLDLRLEQILVMDPGRVYPRCTGGRRAAPPEASGGVWAFAGLVPPLDALHGNTHPGSRRSPTCAPACRNHPTAGTPRHRRRRPWTSTSRPAPTARPPDPAAAAGRTTSAMPDAPATRTTVRRPPPSPRRLTVVPQVTPRRRPTTIHWTYVPPVRRVSRLHLQGSSRDAGGQRPRRAETGAPHASVPGRSTAENPRGLSAAGRRGVS